MANSRPHHRRIGEILIEEGVISSAQLQEALSHQRQTGELLGSILMDMRLVTESDVAKIVSVQYQLPFLSLKNYENDPSLVELFDGAFLHAHRLLPVDRIGNTLLIVVTEIPTDAVLAEIPARTGLNAALYVGFSSEVKRELDSIVQLPNEEKAKVDEEKAKAKAAAKAGASGAAGARGDGQSAKEDALDDEDALFQGDGKDFMSELDSTWDSIFEQLDTSTGEEKQDSAS